MRRRLAKTLGGGALLLAVAFARQSQRHAPTSAPSEPHEARGVPELPDPRRQTERLTTRTLRLPTGLPAGLSCEEARKVVRQARAELAAEPPAVDAKALAEATADWLDPHGLWSVAPDAPIAAVLERNAEQLRAELEDVAGETSCRVSEETGAQLAAWSMHLRLILKEAEARAEHLDRRAAFELAAGDVFEDRLVERPARELARELGRRLGVVTRAYGPAMAEYVDLARERFLPELDPADWARIVLAAAVRAYVPLMDPHGGWAPLDEETSLYELDLESLPLDRLWGRMARTALGARIDAAPLDALAEGDLVLEVMQIPTAGLSVEQLEQLSLLDGGEGEALRSAVVLRAGDDEPRLVPILPPKEESIAASGTSPLPFELLPYGDGEVLVVSITDVPDDLGTRLSTTLFRAASPRVPRGLVLDLRGNGGGSTDGASDAISLFLPGATLFPMLRRDGTIEIERAREPLENERWTGPVAALVDGDTASAAEMIAGALAAYGRGVVIGSRTYGKGCAQEYLDDEVGAGVLRLTTIVYALPDGTPVQRVGLIPTLQLGVADSGERESWLLASLPPWRGPDLREPSRIGEVPWPPHRGKIGPCADELVCRALRSLGAPRPATARGK